MPKKVKKVFGENPESVTVLSTQVNFDENGDAIVEDELAEVLAQIPGYQVEGEAAEVPSEGIEDGGEESADPADEETSEEDEEDEEEEVVKPKRPARKTPGRK